jgi:cell division protein FtsQ
LKDLDDDNEALDNGRRESNSDVEYRNVRQETPKPDKRAKREAKRAVRKAQKEAQRVIESEESPYDDYDDGSYVIREEDDWDEEVSSPKKPIKIKGFLILTAILIVALVICAFVFCRVKVIKVNGVTQYETSEVLAQTGVKEGQSLFFISEKKIENNLLSLYPYVESITLKKTIPSTVEITIEEASVRFSIDYNGSYVYISQNGKLLDNQSTQAEGSILLTGGEYTDEDGYIKFTDEYQQSAFEEICTCLNERGDEVSKITKLDISDVYNISMLYDGRVLMNIGGVSDLRYKLNFGLQIVMGSGISDTEYGTLDLTLSKDNNRAYFTPSTQEAIENGGSSSSSTETDWTLTFDGAGRIVDGVDQVEGASSSSTSESSSDSTDTTDSTDDSTDSYDSTDSTDSTDSYSDDTYSDETYTEESTDDTYSDETYSDDTYTQDSTDEGTTYDESVAGAARGDDIPDF